MNFTPSQMQRMGQILRSIKQAPTVQFNPNTGMAERGLLGAASKQEISRMPAMSPFTDYPDEYYLNKHITDFNSAELEELRRRINEREDFATKYYGF
jgi:hypothetical protein